MTTGFMFRASFEIVDPKRTFAMLRAEACARVDDLAAKKNAVIVGPISWSIHEGWLIGQAPARPIASQQAREAA